MTPSLALASTLLDHWLPAPPAGEYPLRASHLANVVNKVFGADIELATWAAAFAARGISTTPTANGDFDIDVSERLALDLCPQTWPENAEPTLKRFELFSDETGGEVH